MTTLSILRREKQALPVPNDERFLESFRLLALNLGTLLQAHSTRWIVVMSARHGDGRTLVAATLAKALAEINQPVVLVNADPIGRGLNGSAPHVVGSNGNGHDDGRLHAFDTEANGLRVVTPRTSGHSSQVTLLDDIQTITEEAAKGGRLAVIDTPPCMASSLPFYLAARGAAVLYVARGRPEDTAVHRDVRAQLDLLGALILGIVFNDCN